ncbi:conserved exported hypothetical protein [Tenacibaculum litopenaei]|uniref:hypothetical protein n=1 Tax=Tenacibaculum litopenaei TaxID=396016 RepID=UPI0038956EB8
MRKLVVIITALILSSTSLMANENPVKKEIRTNIVKLLKKAKFNIQTDVQTTIEFLVTKKGEVVILDIDCSNPEICNYIKSKLNYKRVATSANTSVQIFKMPLKIVKG